MGRIAFAALAIYCVIWLIGFVFPGLDRALYWHHHGAHFSAAQAATFLEKNTGIQNVTCNTQDANGWDYACTYRDSEEGMLHRIGVEKNGLSSGEVPIGQPLPPR